MDDEISLYARRKKVRLSNEKYVSFSINLPLSLYGEIRRRAENVGMRHVGPYIRAVLLRDVRDANPMTLTQMLRHEHEDAVIIPRDTPSIYPLDPPHKYQGFVGGLRRSSWVLMWFRKMSEKKSRKILDKEDGRQYNLFNSNGDVH